MTKDEGPIEKQIKIFWAEATANAFRSWLNLQLPGPPAGNPADSLSAFKMNLKNLSYAAGAQKQDKLANGCVSLSPLLSHEGHLFVLLWSQMPIMVIYFEIKAKLQNTKPQTDYRHRQDFSS